jgi:hypothetical protein
MPPQSHQCNRYLTPPHKPGLQLRANSPPSSFADGSQTRREEQPVPNHQRQQERHLIPTRRSTRTAAGAGAKVALWVAVHSGTGQFTGVRARDMSCGANAHELRWTRPAQALKPRFRSDLRHSGQAVVQRTSTATSSTVSDFVRLRPATELPQRPRATLLPRVRIEGVRGSNPLSSTSFRSSKAWKASAAN